MNIFHCFLALFGPYFLYKIGVKKGQKGAKIPLKITHFWLEFLYIPFHPKKWCFFAWRSILGFQKPRYFPMNRYTWFWVGVATVELGGCIRGFFTHIFMRLYKIRYPPMGAPAKANSDLYRLGHPEKRCFFGPGFLPVCEKTHFFWCPDLGGFQNDWKPHCF